MLRSGMIFFLLIYFVCVVQQNTYGQLLKLTSKDDFRHCASDAGYRPDITNESDAGAFAKYKISWGDGSIEEEFTSAPPKHIYKEKGHYILQFWGIKVDNSVVGPVTYDVYNDKGRPILGLKTGGEGGLCVGDQISFIVQELQSNTPNTFYHLEFSDGNSKEFYGSEYEGKTEAVIQHKYNLSSCDIVGNKDGKVRVLLRAMNACKDSMEVEFGPYQIVSPVNMYFNLPNKECTGNAIDLQALTGYEPNDCMTVNLNWDITDEAGNVEEMVLSPYVFSKTGTYKVRAYANRGGVGCSQGEIIKTIKIIQRVKAIATPAKSEICESAGIQLKGSDSEGDEKEYEWTVIKGNAPDVSFTTDAKVADPMATFKKYGNYRLQLKVSNGCSVDYAFVDVVVKKNPEITAFNPLPAMCPGSTLNLNGYISYDWTWEGNPQKPTWTLEGPVKGDEFLLASNNQPYPRLKFSNPGEYTLNVALVGVGCGNVEKLKALQKITIYDPDITGNITYSPALDVCENADIVFTNNMQGVNLNTVWTVWQGGSVADPSKYTETSANDGKIRTFRFNTYGDYKIVASLTAQCSTDAKEFTIKIRRAPEVYFKEFPAVICPETPFLPGIYTDYRPNGNKMTYTWEVTGAGPVEFEGANGANPKIIFHDYGDYKVTLKIDNPTSCVSPSLRISKDLKVSNPQMDLNIQPDKTAICVKEQVVFENNSTVAIEPTYYWSVSPDSYQFTNPDGINSKAPSIKFTASGVYNITGVVNGVCKPEILPFTVVVKQDPEVVLDSITPMCPGNLLLTSDIVHYTWNDNWKSGAESTRRVVWRLIDKPTGATTTPPESVEWDAQYPKLQLSTPGDYILQVEIKSDAGCGGTKLIASRVVKVYDPTLQIDVKPQVNSNVVELVAGREYQAVEGSPVQFINNSRGVGLRGQWSVDKPENATISDANANAPSITFKKYGVYKVRVDLIGTCRSDHRIFSIVVKGVPKFDFKPIPNQCDNSGEIDLKNYITCDSAGSTNIICDWSIDPPVGYSVTGNSLSDMFFKVKFNDPGQYKLTLKAQAEYGGVQTVHQTVNILRSAVVAKARLSQDKGCTTDGLQVVALNESDIDSATYTWRVTPQAGTSLVATSGKLTVDFEKAGDYQIVLKAKNICGENEISYPIHAYAKPEVAVIGSTDLGRVCERGYLFIGSEHIGEIKVNNDPLTSIQWSVSPEGVTWENHTTSKDERPDMSFLGVKNYTITGKFKNHCKDTVEVHYTLAVDQYIPVKLMHDTTVCARTAPFLLVANPDGGEWSCNDATMVEKRENKNYYFNPYRDQLDVYQMTYKRGNGECLTTATMKVSVNKLPVVDAGEDRQACLNSEPIQLAGIIPLDGKWKGTGVRDDLFYPGENGDGKFRLEYWYTDMSTGCPNLDTIVMMVYPLPNASFKASAQQCRVTDSLYTPVELGMGHSFSWDFGNGDILTTEDAAATYQYPEAGEYPVTLTATSVNNCRVIGSTQTVTVLHLPPLPAFTLADTAGCGPFTANPLVNPDDFSGDYLNLKYFWDFGNGNTSALQQPDPQIYPATLFDTTYRMIFKVYNVCGEQADTVSIGAWSEAVARFSMNPDPDNLLGLCTPVTPTFINSSTGTNPSYTWDFGGLGASHAVDTVYTFSTGLSASIYTVTLRATNRCNREESTAARTFKVKPNPIVAGFAMSEKYICAGDTICFTNNSVDRDPDNALLCSWDFGDGQVATVWDSCHRYSIAGAYRVKMTVDNGCARREFADSVFVHVIPVLELAGDGPLCEDLELEMTLSSAEPLKNTIWDFGDGTDNEKGLFQVKHAFTEPGTYRVKVRGESNQISSCPGEVVKTIEVWSNPRVTILPLDTMACPPLEYFPVITASSYDYFTWDYGDGSALTSDMSHIYLNDTNGILSYDVTAYVENNYGCKEEHHGIIRIYNRPKTAWDREVSYGRPEKVRFVNLSRDYTDCYWYLPDGQVINSPEHQTVVFENEGVYPISLSTVNQYGCRDSIYQDYRSYEGGLYFPNSFIPHSSNPKVNHFNGIGMGLKEYKLEIFDMYGNKIWETSALEDGMPSEGWDGRNEKGERLPQGTYVWRARAIFFSEDVWVGNNNRSGNNQTTQGTVLLLRE